MSITKKSELVGHVNVIEDFLQRSSDMTTEEILSEIEQNDSDTGTAFEAIAGFLEKIKS